jgi:hypothetical protein
MVSDGELIARCLAGDRAAFDEAVPDTPEARRLVRQGKLRSLHVRVDSVEYNSPVPANAFETTTPKGWTVVHRRAATRGAGDTLLPHKPSGG